MNIVEFINAVLRPLDICLVRASKFEQHYFAIETESRQRLLLPEGALQYLSRTNRRLVDLRTRYCAINDHPVRAHSLWCEDFTEEIDLTSFRGDNAYLRQGTRGAQRLLWPLIGYYTKEIDELQLLDRLEEDGLFGAYRFHFLNKYVASKDLVDSINEINFLERNIGLSQIPSVSVLDIGAGYGRLAHRLTQSFPDKIGGYCVDAIPESTFLSEYYLKLRGTAERFAVISLDEIEEQLRNKGKTVDLVTNVHSFSECTVQAIGWWLDLAVDLRARYLFIVPNAYHNGGEKLLSRELDGSFEDFMPLVEKRGFRLAVWEPKYKDTCFDPLGANTFYFLFERR